MGDDFDLFPKRENLDPFSFGRKEKGGTEEKEGPSQDIFGTPPPKAEEPLPDAGRRPALRPPAAAAPAGKVRPAPASFDLGSKGPSLPSAEELELSGPAPQAPAESRGARGKAASRKEAAGKKTSPFVLVGGSLLILLLALYGVMTFLKRAKPAPKPQQASVAVTSPAAVAPAATPPVEAPAPPTGATPGAAEVPPRAPVAPAAPAPAKPEAAPAPVKPPARTTVQAQEQPRASAPQTAASAPAAPKPAEEGGYTVQVGSLILKSSIRELEEKLNRLGYQPFEKEGTTTAKMNHLAAGPFQSQTSAQAAVARLREAGIEAELHKKPGGQYAVFAGSYLVRENAEQVMGKVRSLGYPVELTERNAQLPLTSVRVGRYATVEEANAARDKLKGQGFEPVVVRLK